MPRPSSPSKSKADVKNGKDAKNNSEDIDNDEELDDGEDFLFPDKDDSDIKKMAARRKIDMYFEKKRLKELLGDYDDIDYDF